MARTSLKTRARALEVIRAASAPVTVADLAAVLECSSAHAWIICRELHNERAVRVGGWRVEARGVRAPKYDTRVDLPDEPKPAPMTRSESSQQYRERLRADPERLAEYMRKAREYHRGYERRRRRPRMSMHAYWCWQALQQLAGAARSPFEVAQRAGLEVDEAQVALIELHTRDKRLVRIGGWLPVPGAPIPLYDLCIRRQDEPKPDANYRPDKYAMLMHARITQGETACSI